MNNMARKVQKAVQSLMKNLIVTTMVKFSKIDEKR